MRIWLAVALVFTVASCSKENNIDNSTTTSLVGQQCTGADDKGCGVGAVCALGFCRSGCTTDAECTKGALCVGDRPPFGCTLPAELACSSSQPCAAPLTCGLDGKCRNRCKVTTDCIRNEQACIAGACVSPSDPDPRWTLCVEGESTCAQTIPELASACKATGQCNDLFVCHRSAPGWSSIGACSSDAEIHCAANGTEKGKRYAMCSLREAPGCRDVPAVPRPGQPCTLGAPGPFCTTAPTTAVYSVLINGTEFTDGITNDCHVGTLQLSESLCSRLAGGTPEIRIRVCFP